VNGKTWLDKKMWLDAPCEDSAGAGYTQSAPEHGCVGSLVTLSGSVDVGGIVSSSVQGNCWEYNVPQDKRTMSTQWSTSVKHTSSLLGSPYAWVARTNDRAQYLRLSLLPGGAGASGSVALPVAGVVLQGRAQGHARCCRNQFVKQYFVRALMQNSAGSAWAWDFVDNGALFQGQKSTSQWNQKIRGVFNSVVDTYAVEIRPYEWNNRISLRAGILIASSTDKAACGAGNGVATRAARTIRGNGKENVDEDGNDLGVVEILANEEGTGATPAANEHFAEEESESSAAEEIAGPAGEVDSAAVLDGGAAAADETADANNDGALNNVFALSETQVSTLLAQAKLADAEVASLAGTDAELTETELLEAEGMSADEIEMSLAADAGGEALVQEDADTPRGGPTSTAPVAVTIGTTAWIAAAILALIMA
jgi:hypothetical protein